MHIRGNAASKAELLAIAAMPFVALASMATPALAQETAIKGTQAAPPQDSTVASQPAGQVASDTVGDIVVTAQKRDQSAQDVGITLNAYSGEQLTRAGVVSAPDIARLTPGVGTSGAFAGQSVTFSIRGVTQQDFQAHAEGPVALYIDEGYLAANNAAGVGLFDIERVEVLKGPQGTLFGRNATGGLVSITTKKPTKTLAADASLSYGSYNNVRAEAAIGGPLSDNVQFRVAGLYDRNDGWVHNLSPTGGDLGGKESFAVRAHLAVQPSSNISLLFTGYLSDVRQSWGPYFALATRSVLTNGVPNAVIVQQPTFFGPASNGPDLQVTSGAAQSTGGYNRVAGGTFRANIDLGGTDLTSITDYKVLKYNLLLDDAVSDPSLLTTKTTARVKNLSQELRLYHDFHGARLTTGLYYLNIDSSQVDVQRLVTIKVASPLSLETNSYSAFAQGEVDLTSKVTLIGGFRATREEKTYNYNAVLEALDETPIAPLRSYSGTSGQWLYSWKAQAEFRPVDHVLFYAGYSRGTKAGSFNEPFAGSANPTDPNIPYKAEKLDSFELGAKTSLSQHVTLNASVFHYIYQDYQAFDFINLASSVSNNPARETGAEIELNVRPTGRLELMGSVSYVDAKVRNVTISNSSGTAVLDRNPPFTSKWQAVASARYELPFATGSLAFQGDAQYRSSFFFALSNFDATRVAGYALLNGRISWTTSNNQWEFAVFGKNLTDKRYRTVGFEASDIAGLTQVGYGEPRWLGGSIRYKLR